MFSSIFSQLLRKWLIKPKMFVVNVKIKVGDLVTYKEIEVVSRNKSDAYEIATQKALNYVVIVVTGSKTIRSKELFNS